MHDWGDKDVDWVAINDAASYIKTFCTTWGRIGGQAKEKFGTVRFYANFGWLSLHNLIYPGYSYRYSRFPKWLWNLDIDYISKALRYFFGKPFLKWQGFIYRKAYERALNKWPHIQPEILSCADYPELLKNNTIVLGDTIYIIDNNGKVISERTNHRWENEL